jgi:adenylylsulfate kinase
VRGGAVVWVTGRPSSGKSTLAGAIVARLRDAGAACALLDGDDVREALGRPAGRGEAEREAFYAVLGRLAALLARQGLRVVVAATSHRREHRERARALAPRFVEVHVATPAEECERRDAKGLYAQARAGGTVELPGAEVEYEAPLAAEVVAADGEDAEAARAPAELALAARPTTNSRT